MNATDNPYRSPEWTMAAHADVDARSDFITKTYLHLAGAVALLVLLETVLLSLPATAGLVAMMIGQRVSWLVVLGLFMAVSWIAERWALSATSPGKQYLGLGLFVVAEAIIFLPLLYIAKHSYPEAIPAAVVATLGLFCVLTAIVFITRKDFSFLRSILIFGGVAGLGLITCGILFGFTLGPLFTYAMIALACGYILYSTSNILHHYHIGQHVAAALALFAAVALLFWYILQLFMSRD